MQNLRELERRITALEEEVRGERHDTHRLLIAQETTLRHVEALTRRAATLERMVDTQGQFAGICKQILELRDHFDAKIDALEGKCDALRCMLEEMLREENKDS